MDKTEIEIDKLQITAESDALKKEQDDLLLLLAEQDSRIKSYRKRLKELGEKVNLVEIISVLHIFVML